MKPGDLVLFAWPGSWSKVGDPLDWENARVGLIVDISAKRPRDEIGNEFLVLYEGERWSVPEAWCRKINADSPAGGIDD